MVNVRLQQSHCKFILAPTCADVVVYCQQASTPGCKRHQRQHNASVPITSAVKACALHKVEPLCDPELLPKAKQSPGQQLAAPHSVGEVSDDLHL